MNIYSLEAFEQKLPVEKVRPPWRRPEPDGPRLALCEAAQDTWDGAPPAPPAGSIALLCPRAAARDAERFLQRLGMAAQGGRAFAGVLLDPNANVDLSVWRRAFESAPLIARADCPQQIAALRAAGVPFGLLLDARGGILPVRRALAVQGLQRVWASAPVFLLAAGCPDGAEALQRAVEGWHVCAADVPGAVPGVLLVRRATWPKALSAGGALPLRLWVQNVGAAPVYGPSRLQLRLGGVDLPIPLGLARRVWPVGDTVYNEITQLPGTAPGRYPLEYRIRREDANPSVFTGDAGDGWQALGEVVLDGTARPELYAAWDNYYPDGYYPLEDPKLPV